MARHARKVRALARRAPEPLDRAALGPVRPVHEMTGLRLIGRADRTRVAVVGLRRATADRIGTVDQIETVRQIHADAMTVAVGEGNPPIGKGRGLPIARAAAVVGANGQVVLGRLPEHLVAARVTGAAEQTVPIGAPAVALAVEPMRDQGDSIATTQRRGVRSAVRPMAIVTAGRRRGPAATGHGVLGTTRVVLLTARGVTATRSGRRPVVPKRGTTCGPHSVMMRVTSLGAPSRTGLGCRWTGFARFAQTGGRSSAVTAIERSRSPDPGPRGRLANLVAFVLRISSRTSASGSGCPNRPGSRTTPRSSPSQTCTYGLHRSRRRCLQCASAPANCPTR